MDFFTPLKIDITPISPIAALTCSTVLLSLLFSAPQIVPFLQYSFIFHHPRIQNFIPLYLFPLTDHWISVIEFSGKPKWWKIIVKASWNWYFLGLLGIYSTMIFTKTRSGCSCLLHIFNCYLYDHSFLDYFFFFFENTTTSFRL